MPGLPMQSALMDFTPRSRALSNSPPDVHRDHHRRDDVGACLAGLMLGVVIQGGPRRRSNGRIPAPRRADLGRRPAVSASWVAVDVREPPPPGVAIQVEDPRAGVLTEAGDPQLSRWENEGGRVRDTPLRVHRVADLRRSA